jgi:alpha 1,2-mannosyltransferase
MIPKWRWIGAGIGTLVSHETLGAAIAGIIWKCATDFQVLIHILASIHPTYRATTNPMKFVPESWRDYKSALNSPGIPNAVIPNVGQPEGQLPEFESLRNNSAVDGRRKANAVFVVLGEL